MNDFTKIYKTTNRETKLEFLQQLLQKETHLQQLFVQFAQGQNLATIVEVDIDKNRDEIWKELSGLDTENIMDSCHHSYYDEDEIGDEILENIFKPYFDTVLVYLNKEEYLNAFHSILAIYEITVVELPDIEDDYYIFGDAIEDYIQDIVSNYLNTFTKALSSKDIPTEIIKLFIELFFKRYLKYKAYYLYNFDNLFEVLIQQSNTATYLLHKLEEYNLYSAESAIILLRIATVIDDDSLYLKVANEFYEYEEKIALALLKKYKTLNQESNFAKIAQTLLEQKNNSSYTLIIIDTINKEKYEETYIKALKIYITDAKSVAHYKLLREYLDQSDRLIFIETMNKFFSSSFYIKLLEIEQEYKKILLFSQKYNDSYTLKKVLEPIVTIYPNEVFDNIKKQVNTLVGERGRNNYQTASSLLQLMLSVPSKQEELRIFIKKHYEHQPRLPALRDELNKAGLLK